MNRDFLIPHHDNRFPSPLSETEEEDLQASELVSNNSDIPIAASLTLSTSAFHYPDSSDTNYMVLQTNFDKGNAKHKGQPFPTVAKKRQKWTEKQRHFASNAIVPSDLQDFVFEVSVL
jgi:hypothetical protein